MGIKRGIKFENEKESVKIEKPKNDPYFHDQKSRDDEKEQNYVTEPGAILKRGIKFENEKELDEYMSNNIDSVKKKKEKKNKSPEKMQNSSGKRPIMIRITRSCEGHKSLGSLYKSQIK